MLLQQLLLHKLPYPYFLRDILFLGRRLGTVPYPRPLLAPPTPSFSGLSYASTAFPELCCERAQLADGQDILELGCGWGSMCLFMAAKYPRSRVTAVSNSRTQKALIDARATERGLTNLRVITEDVVVFQTAERFDRVVSIEMFEHMKNYQARLLNDVHLQAHRGGCTGAV